MDINQLFDLRGKVALVTGGSRGMGAEIVRAYAAAGADLVITSRKLDACSAMAREVEGIGRRALPVSCHMGYWEQIDALIDAAYSEFGRIDILVNNAGMAPVTASSDETSEAAFDKILDVNFKGPFRLSARIARRMADGDGGSIINVSSASALLAQPYDTCYAGAKAALNAASICFAQEYGPKVRVNVLSPGPFLTDIAKGFSEEFREKIASHNALKRFAAADEIAAAALYLAGPGASFTTGALLRVDGGLA